jgi:hypothetical protein
VQYAQRQSAEQLDQEEQNGFLDIGVGSDSAILAPFLLASRVRDRVSLARSAGSQTVFVFRRFHSAKNGARLALRHPFLYSRRVSQ